LSRGRSPYAWMRGGFKPGPHAQLFLICSERDGFLSRRSPLLRGHAREVAGRQECRARGRVSLWLETAACALGWSASA
jgi:hypothetical protein